MSYRSRISTSFLAITVVCAAAWADGPADDSAPLATRPGVLVFRSGRVVEGQIAETETHYVVVRPVGRVEVAKDEIVMVAKDLDTVYRQKASHINDRDPDEHMKLAQWCLLVNLRERAILELERTSDLSGDPKRVRGLLEALRRSAAVVDKPKPAIAETVEPRGRSAAPERQPAEKDVTPAAISAFTLQIQPMLTRSCSTTGCHDTTHAGPLALGRSSVPNPRSTQNNLRAVLAVIDANDPDQSPLVALAARPHPRDGRSETSNVLKDAAFATLVDWTRNVAGKRAASANEQQLNDATSPGALPPSGSNPATDPPAKPNVVKSNQPLILTPSRARAGMTYMPPSAKPSTATANATPPTTPAPPAVEQKKPTTQPPIEPNVSGPPRAATRDAGTSTPREPADAIAQTAAPRKPVTDDYQPVDPFDPEIFNRQFAPRDAGQRP